MIELTRFQQLRPAQRISDEEKFQVGLYVYPDDQLSSFSNDLCNAKSLEAYAAAIKGYRDANARREITEIEDIKQPVRKVYEWLAFKARPIQLEHLKAFAQSLKSNPKLELTEWRFYADQFLLASAKRVLHVNYCVDFQLLIRSCYLIRKCLKVAGASYHVIPSVTADLIYRILNDPIILPKGVLHSRCWEHCSATGSVSLPKPSPPSSAVAPPSMPPLVAPSGPPRININIPTRCECRVDTGCKEPSRHCICIRTYVADLFIIREELARFEEGDIAHIENILAGESKIRRHRTLSRTEESTERETEKVSTEERDHQVSEKFSLQSEVKKVVDQKVHVDAGVTATLKYGNSVTLTPHANVTADFSKNRSDSIARSYAKEVVDRAVSKMQEKVREVQISKVISELEERNKHVIDNTEDDHRAGIYYWVNKVTHAQVFNYGAHTMFDAIVPEPAAMFKKLYELKLKKDRADILPTKPNLTQQGIRRDNYIKLLADYEVVSSEEGLEPPDDQVCVEMAFSHNVAEPENSRVVAFSAHDFKSPEIPEGYAAETMFYDVRCSTAHPKGTGGWKDEVAVSVNVGEHCILTEHLNEYPKGTQTPLSHQNWKEAEARTMKGESGIVSVSVAGFTSLGLSLSGSISIVCKLTTAAFEKWQLKVFNAIMTDYNRKLEAYRNSQNADDPLIRIKGRNPFLNREIERNEFKRHIIAILMCNYFSGMGSMMERVEQCGYPEPDFEKLAKDAPVIQFFEQVFEWEYMNYLFYHSMWARKAKWPVLIDEDSGDPLFDKFLMSGAARVQVPIRPGMEEVFRYFLETGQIWNASGTPPISGDDDYVSMIQEMRAAKQGDYSDRPGLVEVVLNSDQVKLTKSTFYWDALNNQLNTLAMDNDVDREILIDFKIYRVVKVEQTTPGDKSAWTITIDKRYPKPSAKNLKHAVGARFVGAPWEIVIPTKLVYLRNDQDKLPVYPLT